MIYSFFAIQLFRALLRSRNLEKGKEKFFVAYHICCEDDFMGHLIALTIFFLTFLIHCLMQQIFTTTISRILFFSLFVSQWTNNAQATTCSVNSQTQLIACLSSIATSGDILRLSDNFTLTGSITLPNKTFMLETGGYNITFSSVTFNAAGTPEMTIMSSPTITVIKTASPTFATMASYSTLSAFIAAQNPVLSTELTSFNATSMSDGTLLTWLVAQDNAEKFEVEKSIDGKVFRNVSTVQATKSTAQTPQYYKFKDEKNTFKTAYYRIKTIDVGEKTTYSKSLAVVSERQKEALKVFPNPLSSSDYLNVEASVDIQNILIINTLGQVDLTTFSSAQIPVGDLPSGLYTLIAKSNGSILTSKFLKN